MHTTQGIPDDGFYGMAEELKRGILTLKQQWQLEARIDELNHATAKGNDVIMCYFSQDNPDCSKDEPVEDRLEHLEAQLTQSQKQ
jgi:hypothetical protein